MRFLKEENFEANQWLKNGDHPKDDPRTLIPEKGDPFLGEGAVVRYFRHPDVNGENICPTCNKPMKEHGWIEETNLFIPVEGGHVVCPGSWIRTYNITHTQGGPEKYEVLPYSFDLTKEYQQFGTIKLMGEPNVADLEKLNARLLWHVKLDKKYYPVYDISTHHHYGRDNGDIDHWWVKFGDAFYPYSDKHTNRICFEYNFREYNSTKFKWDELRISRGVSVTILANDKPYYQFNTHKIEYAFAKAQQIVVKMMEHPYNFLEPEKENGRKIHFYGLPATVKPSSHPGEIGIVPDYTTGINRNDWWRLYNLRRQPVGGEPDKEWAEIEAAENEEHMHDDYINWGDALSDGNIDWFRKDKPQGGVDESASVSPK